MLPTLANTTDLQPRLKHAKWENNLDHAVLKARKEVVNKTKGDEEHTFTVTEHVDESTLIIWAQNMNNETSSVVYSRSYLISLHAGTED